MIDETTLRRLAYVKSIHNLSELQFRPFSDIEISRSIVSLDSAVEAFIWIILGYKAPKKVNSLHGKNFGDLLDELKKHVKNFDINSIRELHSVRNNIQHSSLLIAESQARRYHPIAEKMFQELCTSVFKIDWKFISLSMLIEDAQVRNLLQTAEKYFGNTEYKKTAKYIIMAFEVAKVFRQFGQAGSGITISRIESEEILQSKKGGPEILEYTQKIEQELEVLKLGLDYSQWLGYRRDLGNVNPLESLYDDVDKDLDEESISLFQNDDGDIELWVRKNLPFVRDSILRWQDSMLNIGDFMLKFAETLGNLAETVKKSQDSETRE